jgi:hypothetical protein
MWCTQQLITRLYALLIAPVRFISTVGVLALLTRVHKTHNNIKTRFLIVIHLQICTFSQRARLNAHKQCMAFICLFSK